ncbi:DUF6194 family protein [Cognatilysobacter bugurensis]|uniref:DUF6194 domain-containing protein n=1 Tax=Cognatilysobacter bugurensis TaxID=543356 RepID=A0A918T384_9GAMM|nr:DUF6194 family protein [Lysobacter bugurensis]GHA86366.1 hypothetical protein GCM10007067_25520 [Lysobacter bugurensis]
MEESSVAQYICESFEGIVPVCAWGETSFFYNPGLVLPRGVYFATLKVKDGDNDQASDLARPGVFRLNMGIGKPTYRSLFGLPPARPAAGGVVNTGHDFSVLDTLTPHPVYGWMAWVSVLNPSAQTFETIKPLLREAHELAAVKFDKRVAAA